MMATVRRQQRKQELLTATHRVISERGIAGASVRAVADRAALSPGSILYYFESFEELVTAAVESAMEEFGDRRRRLLDAAADPITGLCQMVEAGIPERISDELRIVYEVSSVLRDKPQFRASVALLMDRQVAIYRDLIRWGTESGVFRPVMEEATIAENLVALEDAYGLYLLDPSSDRRPHYVRNALRFAEAALGCTLLPATPDDTLEPLGKDSTP
ncbi:TetR/AcrR family transcriptional regulator [Arthrobacter sp. NPDC090010]|uniref:TetR/AcrR family transcriptional regulator n=1 Tax=Arthrobacter sp. NPDC090010 TaxID=3363942 RepID=UPI0037F243F4